MSYTAYRKDLLPALSTSSGSRLMKASSSPSPSALRAPVLPPPGPAPRAPRQPMKSLRPTEKEHSKDHSSSVCRAAKVDSLFSRQNNATTTAATTTGKGTHVDETTNHHKIGRALIGRFRNSFPNPPSRQINCRQWHSEYADQFRVPGGPFPPRVPRGSTLHPDHYPPGVRYTVPQGKTLLTEYQACFTGIDGMLARQKARQLLAKKHVTM